MRYRNMNMLSGKFIQYLGRAQLRPSTGVDTMNGHSYCSFLFLPSSSPFSFLFSSLLSLLLFSAAPAASTKIDSVIFQFLLLFLPLFLPSHQAWDLSALLVFFSSSIFSISLLFQKVSQREAILF